MKIYFSRHAKNRMRRFKVESEEVVAAIEAPDILVESHKGRKNAWKKRSGGYLRVTFCTEDSRDIVVVTVTVKRKLSGEEDGNEN
ncbi:MAG: DUF4258 domain-containing protein [Armatimonadetes bacterium]|nr:DUF4258 domain-containing protein [Armatimonadota bacterium]